MQCDTRLRLVHHPCPLIYSSQKPPLHGHGLILCGIGHHELNDRVDISLFVYLA